MGLCPTLRTKGTKMDVWAQLWPIPYKNGKVHKSVVRIVAGQITAFSTFEDIYHKVVKADVWDDDDILATSRTLWQIRDNIRETVNGGRKELMS